MANVVDPWCWFDEAKFGLFIHWGIYSLLGRGEQVLFRERLDPAEYARLADKFDPKLFDADEWAGQAKEAGMKYAVLTTKHHDGFCLFDSDVSDFTSTKTAAKRDFVSEYVEALRRAGLKVGLYYSLGDWRWPSYFKGPHKDPAEWAKFLNYTHTQVKELCTNYGPVDVMWFDGGWPWTAADWQSESIDGIIRKYQPYIWINDRLHGGGDGNVQPVGDFSRKTEGYYETAEQRPPGSLADRPMETCRTSNSFWWGYAAGERLWKSPREVVHLLVQAAEAGANLLYNVGPRPDGAFPAKFSSALKHVGRWMNTNGESIYGTRAGVCDVCTVGRTTRKGDTLYLHVLYWSGRELTIHGLSNKVYSAHILATGQPVGVQQAGLGVRLIGLPSNAPDPYDSVIVLKLDGEPREDPSVVRLWQPDADMDSLVRWASGSGCAPNSW